MKIKAVYFFILSIILLAFNPESLIGQESTGSSKTAISFNITRMLVNEINIGFERVTSKRKSFEFDGGIIYPNTFFQDAAETFTDDPYFYEEGYAGRFHLKYWRDRENSKWRNYIAPGISYKHVYYNDYPLSIDKTDSQGKPYTETLLQDRVRDKFGVDIIWGNVYEASNSFAFEIYYGAGATISSVKRTDHDRYATYERSSDQAKNSSIPTYIDYSLYFRPVLLLGFKLVIRL